MFSTYLHLQAAAMLPQHTEHSCSVCCDATSRGRAAAAA